MNAAQPAQKTCRACGAVFGCGAQLDHCWCQSLPLLPASALDPTSDCLCPKCLTQKTAPVAAARRAE